MASASAETMILFIAGLVVAAGVAGTLTTQVTQLSDAIDETGLDISQEVRTDIEVISDSGSSNIVQSNGNVTLYVKNTGSNDLAVDADSIQVIVNGTYIADVEVSRLDFSGQWSPGEVVELDVGAGIDTSTAADHRVKVVVNGDEEVFEFRYEP